MCVMLCNHWKGGRPIADIRNVTLCKCDFFVIVQDIVNPQFFWKSAMTQGCHSV